MLKPEHKKLIQLVTPYCTPGVSTLLGSVNPDNTTTLTIKDLNIPVLEIEKIRTKVSKLGGTLYIFNSLNKCVSLTK